MSAVFHPQRDNLPTRGYSYDLSFFYVIDLHNTKLKKKKMNIQSDLIWDLFLLRQGKRNSQMYFHEINFPIVILGVRGTNKLTFDI